MKHPPGVYAGVVCLVIGGTDNLNVGKRVKVISFQGDHSTLGRIWRCTVTEGALVTEYGAVGESADFAQDWLQPLPPITIDPKQLAVSA